MTQIELYHRIFLVALILTIIFFVLTIVFFFMFDIPKMVGIKTGHVQKKAVKKMRNGQRGGSVRKISEQNEETDALLSGSAETEKLETVGEMTTILEQNSGGHLFVTISEVMEVHSQEIIS